MSGQAGTAFGSYGRQKQQASVSGSQGPVGAALFASYDSTNGYRENSDRRAKDVGGKIIYAGFVHTFYPLLPPEKIDALVRPYLGGNDPVFGYLCDLELPQFFRFRPDRW
jgi:hypothetical protein